MIGLFDLNHNGFTKEKNGLVDENTVMDINKDTMKGSIKSKDCNWTVPYKEGKSIIKASVTDHGGDVKDVTFTITGRGEKVYPTTVVDDEPNRVIRVALDSFEEAQ